jgi:putative Holliday junction resolvase
MPRILSIDYGMKRTGIAITDEMQIIASGLTTVPSETLIAFLKDYFSKEKVEKVIVGEPKQMDGTPSESAVIIEKFIKKNQRKNKALIDEIAATIMLQDYMNRK